MELQEAIQKLKEHPDCIAVAKYKRTTDDIQLVIKNDVVFWTAGGTCGGPASETVLNALAKKKESWDVYPSLEAVMPVGAGRI